MKAKTLGKVLVVFISAMVVCLFVIPGCSSGGDNGDNLSKDEARSIGKADWAEDFCEVGGWYGDGTCDDFCPKTDPDCGGASCDGKACGDRCDTKPGIPMFCNATGLCTFENPVCGPEQTSVPPVCDKVGTKQEGWYNGTSGEKICTAKCAGTVAICDAIGSRSEGWYAENGNGCRGGNLIGWEKCGGDIPEPTKCGGWAGKLCADDEFCDYYGEFCGAGDKTGICTKRPDTCNKNLAPVCGCDGVRYENDCYANRAGVDVSKDTTCLDQGGCDGKQCGDSCDAQPGIPMYCDAAGTCGFDVPDCGPICKNDDDCAELSCPFWGGLHQTCEDGKCVTPPITDCPDVECGTNQDCTDNKVCVEFKCVAGPEGGCDGKVCGDRCDAMPGIPMYCDANGECAGEIPTCGEEPTKCGGWLGRLCAADEFCDYYGGFCGAGDVTGICTKRPDTCNKNIARVCGCDGVRYENDCYANRAGMDVSKDTTCLD